MKNKLAIGSVALTLTALSGGYLITDSQKADLEAKINQIQYIHAKTIIDERGNKLDLSELIGSSTVEKIIINGKE